MKMMKEKYKKEDGRYLIYYSFEEDNDKDNMEKGKKIKQENR